MYYTIQTLSIEFASMGRTKKRANELKTATTTKISLKLIFMLKLMNGKKRTSKMNVKYTILFMVFIISLEYRGERADNMF